MLIKLMTHISKQLPQPLACILVERCKVAFLLQRLIYDVSTQCILLKILKTLLVCYFVHEYTGNFFPI